MANSQEGEHIVIILPKVENRPRTVLQRVAAQLREHGHVVMTLSADEFTGIIMTSKQKKNLLKAKIAVALQSELGRVPKEDEINQVFLLARVMYKAVLGLHFQRKEQKKYKQLAIF